MKTLPVPRLLLDAIQPLHLMLFDPRVLLPASMHGAHPSLVLHLCILGMTGLLTWTHYPKVSYKQPVFSSLSS